MKSLYFRISTTMFTSKAYLLIFVVSPLILCEIYNCDRTLENSELLIEYIKWREISYLVIVDKDMGTGNLQTFNV